MNIVLSKVSIGIYHFKILIRLCSPIFVVVKILKILIARLIILKTPRYVGLLVIYKFLSIRYCSDYAAEAPIGGGLKIDYKASADRTVETIELSGIWWLLIAIIS